MTAQRLLTVVRQDTAESDAQVQEVSRLFEAKAAGRAVKYAPDEPLTDRKRFGSVVPS